MAIIVATVDTDENTLIVTVNGKKVPNVSDVSMCHYMNYDGEVGCHVCIGATEIDDEAGLITRTHITKAGVSDVPPANIIDKSIQKAVADIRKMFS